jgi:hypothetical protein
VNLPVSFRYLERNENFGQCLPFGSAVTTGIRARGAGQIRQAVAI